MTLTGFIMLLAVAGIVGSIGQAIAGFSRGGCLTSIAVGFVGALLGVWLARNFRLPDLFVITVEGTTFPIVWSIIGAALFVAVIGLFSRRRG
jgi:uncharacterized membrane protein YeaQ/YmgE (transglycosylase-associated protein family)